MRIAVYTDYSYTRDGGAVFAERAFALFLSRLADRLDRMILVGRLAPGRERARYPLPREVEFAPLPYYESLARPLQATAGMFRSLRRFWRALDEVDACWLLGPHPLALAFALIAAVRRRRVFLGVRHDMREYTRNRHPGRRSFSVAAALLEDAFRILARWCPTVVVGPALRRRYEDAARLLEITVSLVDERDVLSVDEAVSRPYGGELVILSVGRIDAEKNPLMLAEVLARLDHGANRWRLVVCGEGPLEEALRARLEELGIADRADLRGYVQHGQAMREAYRSSHVLLHVSLTEGLPQVIVEALAAGLPVVATDVGGISKAVSEQVMLVPSGDVDAAVIALERIAADSDLRVRLISAGNSYARDHTLDSEVDRTVSFLARPERSRVLPDAITR